jgi:hypothetical protein
VVYLKQGTLVSIYERDYLEYSLDILERAHELNYFADGQRRAALIAGTYILRNNTQLEDAQSFIIHQVHKQWLTTGKYAPFPTEKEAPHQIANIIAAIEDNLQGLRQAGHNVILPCLALKAFRIY